MRFLKRLVGFSIISSVSTLFAMADDKPVAPAVPADDVIIKMDPYVVSGERVLPPPESWRYVLVPALEVTWGTKVILAPGFQILSNLSEKNTRTMVEELQLYQLAGTKFWPMIIQALPREPISLIIDRNRQAMTDGGETGTLSWDGDPINHTSPASQSSRYDSSAFSTGIQFYEAGSNVPAAFSTDPTAEDTPAPSNRYSGDSASTTPEPSPFKHKGKNPLPAGFTYVHAKNGALSVRVNADVPLANADLPTEEEISADVSRRLAEYVMFNFTNPPPQWFRVGLGWLIATTEVSQTRIAFGGSNVSFIDHGALPPLEPLLKKVEPLTYEEDLLAAAFTHWGFYGDDHSHAEKFKKLVEQQSQGNLTSASFQEILGSSYKQMERELASYVRSFSSYTSFELRGRIPNLPAFVVREATQSEVSRLKAEDYISIGKPELALNELRIAYWRGEREPAMLATLADLEEKQGSAERSTKIVSALRSLKAPPVLTYFVEARLRFRAMTKSNNGGKLSAQETGKIMNPLSRAIQGGLVNEPLCGFLADVVLKSNGRPHESVVAFLEQAAKRYPRNKAVGEALAFAKSTTPKTEVHSDQPTPNP